MNVSLPFARSLHIQVPMAFVGLGCAEMVFAKKLGSKQIWVLASNKVLHASNEALLPDCEHVLVVHASV